MSVVRSGRVEYEARAFEQDAGHAMRGDILRALIELITNSDDAYGTASGDILVRILGSDDAEYPVIVSVHDAARGLDAAGLIANFGVLGGQKTAEDAGGHVRGLLGRGAKDVASLGPVTFDAVRDGKYSCFNLTEDGRWHLTAENEVPDEDILADMRLEPGENGLTATLHVAKRFAVPKRAQLQTKLSQHAQLRDLTARRPLRIQDYRTDPTMFRVEPLVPAGEVVIDEEISLEGYEPVHLTVRRMPQKAQGHVNTYSAHGLLIMSGVSVFENTWFDLDARQEANFFCGVIDAPQIADVIRAYDTREPLGGPMRLLSRDRDGLVAQHPYRQELARAVMVEVQPYFDSLARELDSGRKQGASLDRAFKVARDALRDQLNAVMNEIEEEVPGGTGPSPTPPLIIVPPVRFVQPGESVVLTARALAIPDATARVSIELPSGDDVVAGGECAGDWTPHPRLPGFRTTVTVAAGLTVGSATVKLEVGELVARASIVVVRPDEEEPVKPPTDLEISPQQASVAPGRGRRLAVRAPVDFVGETLTVTSIGVALESLPGEVVLTAEPGGRWAQAQIRALAGTDKGDVKVRVSADGVGDVTAQLKVDESAGRGGLDVSFNLQAHKSPTRRAELRDENGMLQVTVYGLHPSFSGLFGKYSDEESKFIQEDSPQARAVLAEVVAASLAGYFTEREFEKRPDELNDATRVLRRSVDRANRFQAILHRALAPVVS